jgi:hypothetical protein
MQAAKLLAVADPLAIYQQEQANIELIRCDTAKQSTALAQKFQSREESRIFRRFMRINFRLE